MKAFVVLAAVLATAAAEADPALLYSGLGYAGLGYAAYPYAAHAYAPYGIKGVGYSNDAVSAAGYAHKGQYIANSAGVVHVAKREAEADPALLYSGLGYHGLAYAAPLTYAYGKSAPCVNAANVPVPCAAAGVYGHYLHKREAEADPALVYAGYGAYPYGGLTHSSNVGLCLNYVGQRVPC